jgi:carboxypeptidase Taq
MTAVDDAYRQLCLHATETQKLVSAQGVLEWDHQTMLPRAGGEYRAEQIGFLAGLIHRRQTDPRIGDWLAAVSESPLAADAHSSAGASIFHWSRRFQRLSRIPSALVEELARVCSLAQLAWEKSRHDDDYQLFAPHLARIIELKRQQADAVGFEHCRYDALLDEFEPMASTAEIARVLKTLQAELVPLVQAITGCRSQLDDSFLRRSFPKSRQIELGLAVAAAIGFDFQRGRLDTTAHPFCTGLGPQDCRITTRTDPKYFPTSFFGVIHETGHGLYEQGRPPSDYGLPSGEYCSLGIHESQSRLWENLVARSRGFWTFGLPMVQAHFPGVLDDVSVDQMFAAINRVEASLIRVEADEATYNLHIVIRFELEQELIDGRLTVDDLPAAWNAAYQRVLGILPPSDAAGVLQDIHWSAGLIGYFPTYALGNIYACQLYDRAQSELGPLETMFADGEFRTLLDWLRGEVHGRANRWTSRDLMTLITGNALDSRPLIRHLRDKFFPLYGVPAPK